MARNKYPEETIKLIVDESLKLFLEKGYYKTTIQDITNNLSGLSKGAIYHHFKSKEDIFEAVSCKLSMQNIEFYDSIVREKNIKGIDKLKNLLMSPLVNPTSEAIKTLSEKAISEPKFLKEHIQNIYEIIVPQYFLPVIEEGIRDGTIQTENPKELSEVILTLFNIWLNPFIVSTSKDEMAKKLDYFFFILKNLGINNFNEDEKLQLLNYILCFFYD